MAHDAHELVVVGGAHPGVAIIFFAEDVAGGDPANRARLVDDVDFPAR